MKRYALCLVGTLVVAVSSWGDTISLQVAMTAPRTVTLSWGQAATTTIYRQYPDEVSRVAIATISGTQYIDRQHRAVCDDTVRYSISQQESGTLHEGFASQYMADNEPTAPAEWGVVTVDDGGQSLLLQWVPSADTDIMGYMVCEGTPSIAVDTVFGRLNTQYSPTGYSADSIWHFRICAFDSCRQASALTEVCNNIVATLSSEPCDRQVVLRWNEYLNMPSGILRYEVWASEDGGTLRKVAEVAASGPMQASFVVDETTMSVVAEVRVVSIDGQHSSCSNRVGVTFSTSERPAYFYLRKVSVCDDDATVKIVAQTDPAYSGNIYTVYRAVDNGAAYAIGECQPEADGTLRWTDRSAHPAERVHTYWMGVVDGCGRNEIFTQQGSTMLLQIETEGEVLKLSWNTFEGWEGSTQYEVRSFDVNNNLLDVQNTTASFVTFLLEEQAMQQYRVYAYEGADSRHGRDDSLQSASNSYRPQTSLWVPNAFTPGENINNTFRPISFYTNPEGYHLVIYNRQGMLLYESGDPEAAWDGTAYGQKQPQGVYVYKIEYQANNMPQTKIGTVLLIR